jgi:N-acetylneuraminic acid mutarotase
MKNILCKRVLLGSSFLLILIVANSQQGQWKVLKTKNEIANRSECGLVAANNKLYLIGGDGGSNAVASLDLKTLMWKKLADAPVDMNHFQAVAYDNKIYVLEAFSGGGFPDQTPLENPYIYDIGKNTWSKGAQIAPERRRSGAAAAQYNGKLYLIAGIQHGHSSGTTNMFDMFDPKLNDWIPLSAAPHIRDHCQAAVIGDKLYVVGGRNTSYHEPDNFMAFFAKTVVEVDCYDFKTNMWSTLPAKLPLGSGGGTLVNLNNILYYMGGERATATEPNAPRRNVYYLDPGNSNDWKETDSLHFARNGTAAAVWNNHIYLAGGSGGSPGGPPPNGKPGIPPGQRNDSKPDSATKGFQKSPPPNRMNNNKSKIAIEVFSLR